MTDNTNTEMQDFARSLLVGPRPDTTAEAAPKPQDPQKAQQAKEAQAQQQADQQRQAEATQHANLRRDIATGHGITEEDRDILLTGTDEATLNAQAERLAQIREVPRRLTGPVARNEGKTPTYPKSDAHDFTRKLFGRGD